MFQNGVFNHSLDLVLSDECSDCMTRFLEYGILNKKVKISLYKMKKIE